MTYADLTYAFAHAKIKKLIFYFNILALTGHIGIIFHHFKFFTDSANQFSKSFIHVVFRKNPGIEPSYEFKLWPHPL